MSAKGQVVLPKSVRDQLGWNTGTGLEVVTHAGAVTLRPVVARETLPPDEVFALLAKINPYRGPRVSDEDMDRIIAEQVMQGDPAI